MKKWATIAVCLTASALAGGYIFGPFLHGQVQQPPELPKELTSYRDVVKRVQPAVVSIDSERVVAAPRPNGRFPNQVPPGFEDVPEEFRKFFEDFRNSPFRRNQFQVPERRSMGFGSGFVVDPSGVIMTNYHVIEGAKKVTVRFLDGSKYVSSDIRGDRKTDLALIKIDTGGKNLPYLEFGDSGQMEIGDRVLAFGAPFGLTGTVTSGIVSAKGRSGFKMNMYEDFLQTDAAINPGNSGGPLVSLDGRVVGINAAIKSRSGGFNGVGLAVASNLAKSVKQALLKDGVVRRGYLGVQVTALEPDVRAQLGLAKDVGVVVGRTFDNTPAAKAGLKPGDIITKVNGTTIHDGRDLQMLIAGLPLDKAATMEILRDGKQQTVRVRIEEQPQQFGLAAQPDVPVPQTQPEATSIDAIGVEVVDLTPALAKQLGYDANTQGVAISEVRNGSLASTAGLRPGMLILKVNKQGVTTAKEARDAIADSSLERGVLLQIRSAQGGTNYVLLQSNTK